MVNTYGWSIILTLIISINTIIISVLISNMLTQLRSSEEHRDFCSSILGHALLDINYLEQLYK